MKLSIVVIILQGRESLKQCLTSLTQQQEPTEIEIIVPYDQTNLEVSRIQALFPTVQFLAFEGQRTYAELRSLGVQQAIGKVIAVTEDHCIPKEDWCKQILQAHTASHVAIGGAVEKRAPDSALNWSLYFADYGRYMNPISTGPVKELTDCNVTYKRTALEQIASIWQEEFHEPEVNGSLQGLGETLWLSPKIIVYQQRSIPFKAAIRDRYVFGRLFGGRRALTLSGLKRLVYAGTAIILPFLLTSRIAGHAIRKRRFIGQFFKSLPFLLVLNSVWAMGEGVGYFTGRPENSLSPISSQELQFPSQG